TTVLGVRLPLSGIDVGLVGVIMAGYWVGYVLGGLTGPVLIVRVGRIRTFAGAAGMVTVCVLATTLTSQIGFWVLSRVATGYACAVFYLAIESWLNGAMTAQTRGGVFAGYMIATYFAAAAGQLALDVVPANDMRLLNLVALVFAGALMPLVLTRITPPPLGAPSRFGPLQLWQAAPLATLTCALSGLTTAAFYALAPLYFQAEGRDGHALSWLVASAIVGGLLGQWPLGRLSDMVDRRLVIMGSAAGLAITAPLVAVYPRTGSLMGCCLVLALCGVFLAVIYPLAVARANDTVSHDDVVAASGALILVNGGGSVLGPLLGGMLMHLLGNASLFVMIASAGAGVTLICGLAVRRERICEPQSKPFVVLNARATAGSLAHPKA
ncbi:MAG TPA: MFS transporter, partial [Rhizomicrobium sp.]|nr:MFS transporter [Rhizomicrobium sp.]